jgi:hypothetical protein
MDRFTTPLDEAWLNGAILIAIGMAIYWAVKTLRTTIRGNKPNDH